MKQPKILFLSWLVGLIVAACGSGAEPTDTTNTTAPQANTTAEEGGQGTDVCAPVEGDPVSIPLAASPTNIAAKVAADEGLYPEGISVEPTLSEFGAAVPQLLSRQVPIADVSPWEVAQFRAEGEDLVYLTTAAALNFVNGVLINAEDEGTITGLGDLEGLKVGHPGFQTGTYLAFETLVKATTDLNAREDMELVSAEPGALLGLLATGEIDAAVAFGGQTITAITQPDVFTLLTSFTALWQEQTGQPLVVTGSAAYADWVEENTGAACRFVVGVDRGVQWLKDNPDEYLSADGKYAEWATGGGFIADEATTNYTRDLLENGELYFTSELNTQDWRDALYEFSTLTVGDATPPQEDIFFTPEELTAG